MVKMGGAEALFFLLFLDCWQDVELHRHFHLMKGSLQRKRLQNSEFAPRSNKQEYVARLSGHVPEEKKKKPSLFNRAVSEQFGSVDKEAARPATRNRTLPCLQLLHFLQRNNMVAIGSVVGVLVATALLLLTLTIYNRRKQPLYPPPNMTYNIFIMSGKTWWQKTQEKNSRKNAGKQKQLNCDSCA